MVPFAWELLTGPTASAADRADIKPGRLTISGPAWEIRVLGRGVPLFENLFAPGMCRITFTGRGEELVPRVRECPDALRDEVVPASKYWLFEVDGDVTGVTFDTWYLIDGRGVTGHLGPIRYVVDGDELPVWKLVPKEVAPPSWPVGQVLPARCVVTVTNDKDTGHVRDVAVAEEGCPAGYVPVVTSAARSWTFDALSTNNVPVPLTFEAIVTFTPPSDGADATIDVDLPVPPATSLPVVGLSVSKREMPDSPPLFRLHHRAYTTVEVYGVGTFAPEPAAVPRRCEFLMQVNTSGRTWMWPERCPTELHDALEASRLTWTVVPGKRQPNEQSARFRAFWELPPDGAPPILRVPEADVVSKGELPPGVKSFAVAEAVSRVPPKLPKGTVLGDPQVCVLDVTVGVRGRVTAVRPAEVPGSDPGGCDPALLDPARRSVAKWRWKPAASDGEPFESHASVRVRFGGGA